MADDADTPEPRVGLAGHLADALHRVHTRLRPTLQQDRHDHVVNLLERFETELAPVIGPIVDELLADEALPESFRPMLAELRQPSHFATSLLLGIAVGSTVYPVLGAALAPPVQRVANTAWNADPVIPLSPAEVALAMVKHTLGGRDPEHEASLSGVNADRLNTLYENTGEPPGLGELLSLWRRGKIDTARLEHGIRQSRIRDEWTDAVEMLAVAPMTAEEALEGWLEGQLDEATARRYYEMAGGDPDQFHDRYNIRGQAPTPTQALELLNRGVIAERGSGPDSTSYEQAFLEGPWRNKWLAPFLALRRYIPPVRSIVPMLRNGAITESYARELLAANGVQGSDVDAYVHEAQTGRQAAVRELTTAQIVSMYELRMIDRPTATGRLTGIGWVTDDATLLLDQADERRQQRFTNTLVTKVATLYVGWKIDTVEATHDLNAAGVPPEAQADLFRVWDIERASNLHHPTAAQVLGAYRRGAIDAAETKRRLLAMGVVQADLGIVVADAWPPTRPDPDAVAAVVNA